MRFALFAAFLNALYKGVLCIMRRFCSDDRKNAFVAGFLSALSMAIDDKERRKQIALIVFARSLVRYLDTHDLTFNRTLSWISLMQEGYLRNLSMEKFWFGLFLELLTNIVCLLNLNAWLQLSENSTRKLLPWLRQILSFARFGQRWWEEGKFEVYNHYVIINLNYNYEYLF